jgi:rubrerythrin
MDQKVVNYLLRFFTEAMTKTERSARHAFILHGIAEGRSEKARQIVLKDVSTDHEVLELMKDGYVAFAERVAERLMREQPDDIFLNVCPKCGALARTPTAKQCPACFHAWHDVQ